MGDNILLVHVLVKWHTPLVVFILYLLGEFSLVLLPDVLKQQHLQLHLEILDEILFGIQKFFFHKNVFSKQQIQI